jgi:predicted DNA-binding transcriptional regulator AlpA
MKSHLFCSKGDSTKTLATNRVTVSLWVNEQSLPWNEIVSAHEVARLTRRKRWVFIGLTWIGRFPKKKRYHGRAVGWLRSEILEWNSRNLRLDCAALPGGVARYSAKVQPQRSLPLGFAPPLAPVRRRRRYNRRSGLEATRRGNPTGSHQTSLDERPRT